MKKHTTTQTKFPLSEVTEALARFVDSYRDHNEVLEPSESSLPPHECYDELIKAIRDNDRTGIKKLIKELIGIIQTHFRQEAKNDQLFLNQETSEGMKSIMALVSDSVELFDHILYKDQKRSITQWKEFKNLRKIYKERFSYGKELPYSKYLLELTQQIFQKDLSKHTSPIPEESIKHVAINMENIQKDYEYELLYMRKDNGTKFYDSTLVKNMRLIYGFQDYFYENSSESASHRVLEYRDTHYQLYAHELLSNIQPELAKYMRTGMKNSHSHLVKVLNCALFALHLAGNKYNTLVFQPIKHATKYFEEFLYYFRDALTSEEYRKIQTYSDTSRNKTYSACDRLIRTILSHLFDSQSHLACFHGLLDMLYQSEADSEESIKLTKNASQYTLWEGLSAKLKILKSAFKSSSPYTIHQFLASLNEEKALAFDPWLQGNLPCKWADLYFDKKPIQLLRLPSPTNQELISKAYVIEEFRGAIRALESDKINFSHLLINLQDRTFWTEHARAYALEHLSVNHIFDRGLQVITLPVDTDFFLQTSEHENIDSYEVFSEHLIDQVMEEGSGFWFPDGIRKVITPVLCEYIADTLHELVFNSAKKLSQKERRCFLHLFYGLLTLKILDVTASCSMSFTCKDAVDSGSSWSCLFLGMLKILGNLTTDQSDLFENICFGSSALYKTRIPFEKPIESVFNALQTLEEAKQRMGDQKFADAFAKRLKSICSLSLSELVIH